MNTNTKIAISSIGVTAAVAGIACLCKKVYDKKNYKNIGIAKSKTDKTENIETPDDQETTNKDSE